MVRSNQIRRPTLQGLEDIGNTLGIVGWLFTFIGRLFCHPDAHLEFLQFTGLVAPGAVRRSTPFDSGLGKRRLAFRRRELVLVKSVCLGCGVKTTGCNNNGHRWDPLRGSLRKTWKADGVRWDPKNTWGELKKVQWHP